MLLLRLREKYYTTNLDAVFNINCHAVFYLFVDKQKDKNNNSAK